MGIFRGTAFARYNSPDEARGALEKLGTSVEFGGRKARIELQKSKALIGRRCLEAEVPDEELDIVRIAIEGFLADDSVEEMKLSASFTVQQRKYAHSIAERHSLKHVTSQADSGDKFVLLSKSRCNTSQDTRTAAAGRPRANTHSGGVALSTEGSTWSIGTSAASDEAAMQLAWLSESFGGGQRRRTRKAARNGAMGPDYTSWSPISAPTPVVGALSPITPWLPQPWLPPGLEAAMMLPPPGLSGWDDNDFPSESHVVTEGAFGASIEKALIKVCRNKIGGGYGEERESRGRKSTTGNEDSTEATDDEQPLSDGGTTSAPSSAAASAPDPAGAREH
jgi:hypothetical protein